ncbi:MAG TPA: 30S ribosomal protein S9 [Candidatus Paceibacterota bacterium]|nr:30S ribosomal protein S9 [Candidatus Paceibacterota bacterium]
MPKVKKTKKETVKKVKKAPAKKTVKATVKPKVAKYFEGIGRRKTAVARVRISIQKEKTFLINARTSENYFPTKYLQRIILSPLSLTDYSDKFQVSVRVKGGGTTSQAEAVRHGLTRALVLFDPELRKQLKKAGFLKRDPRMRERKKFGLKRARRAPQWQKR